MDMSLNPNAQICALHTLDIFGKLSSTLLKGKFKDNVNCIPSTSYAKLPDLKGNNYKAIYIIGLYPNENTLKYLAENYDLYVYSNADNIISLCHSLSADFNISGRRRPDEAYFNSLAKDLFPNRKFKVINLLEDYHLWTLTNKESLYLKYALDMISSQFKSTIFISLLKGELLDESINMGRLIDHYLNVEYNYLKEVTPFSTYLFGKKTLMMNCKYSSLILEEHDLSQYYDLLAHYEITHNGKFKVTVINHLGKVKNLDVLAREVGGGGNKNIASYTTGEPIVPRHSAGENEVKDFTPLKDPDVKLLRNIYKSSIIIQTYINNRSRGYLKSRLYVTKYNNIHILAANLFIHSKEQLSELQIAYKALEEKAKAIFTYTWSSRAKAYHVYMFPLVDNDDASIKEILDGLEYNKLDGVFDFYLNKIP